jgi:hypothetical protein
MTRDITPRVVISKIGNKTYEHGIKTRVRYPSEMGGYITHTFVSKSCAEAYVENLSSWAKSRARIFVA